MTNDSRKSAEAEMSAALDRRVHRRAVLGGMAGIAAGVAGAGLVGHQAQAAPSVGHRAIAASSQELPADAAPADRQTIVVPSDGSGVQVIDFYEHVYGRPAFADLFSEPLVRLDKNFQVQPAAAESWTGSEDGMTWTFKIRQGLTWSDGNPVTANDWLATFRYVADPGKEWDFKWYFQGVIKNWSAITAPAEGAEPLPTDQIGVRVGANDYELVFETEAPAPYLPAMLVYSLPLSKAALESTGPLYNTNPETAVSSGPFILTEWSADQRVVYTKNEKYTGSLQVPVTRIENVLASPDSFFTMYQNDEVDYMEKPAPASLQIMLNDPETAKEVYSGVGDFRTNYFYFDVTKAPFDDIKVRQAFSHVIDRDAIQSQILGPGGTPAYSYLAPGFPAANRDGLKDIQAFNPDLGKQLLAEAGFADGNGFPKQQMWLRAPSPLDKTVAAAIAAMIKEHLNIDVELLEKDQPSYMASLNADPSEILLGYISYGMDFFDPPGMMNVWLSGGRHTWVNADFDAKMKEAAQFLGPAEERIALFQEAERILVEDVPAVYVYHETPVQLIKPWLKGTFLDADENGIISMHWPGYTTMSTVPTEVYVGSDAPDRG